MAACCAAFLVGYVARWRVRLRPLGRTIAGVLYESPWRCDRSELFSDLEELRDEYPRARVFVVACDVPAAAVLPGSVVRSDWA